MAKCKSYSDSDAGYKPAHRRPLTTDPELVNTLVALQTFVRAKTNKVESLIGGGIFQREQ